MVLQSIVATFMEALFVEKGIVCISYILESHPRPLHQMPAVLPRTYVYCARNIGLDVRECVIMTENSLESLTYLRVFSPSE
jgi:hypothetical protein